MQTQWNNTTHNCYIASVSQQLGHGLQLGEGLILLLLICESQRHRLGRATLALALHPLLRIHIILLLALVFIIRGAVVAFGLAGDLSRAPLQGCCRRAATALQRRKERVVRAAVPCARASVLF